MQGLHWILWAVLLCLHLPSYKFYASFHHEFWVLHIPTEILCWWIRSSNSKHHQKPKLFNFFTIKTILAVWLIIAWRAFHDPYHTVERLRCHSCPEMREYCSSPGSVQVIRNISTHLSPLQQLVVVAHMHRKSPARTDGWKEPCPSDRSWQPPSTCPAHVLLPSTQHPSRAWDSRRFPSILFYFH